MNERILEICSYSFGGCLNALLGGADRIELCNNSMEGGTTPSYGLIKKVREHIGIKLYPLIRPRDGDFLYTTDEFEIMLQDIEICKQLGCDGVATGVQNVDGRIDIERMKRIVDKAYPLGVTCIRAFDLVPDAFEALDNLIKVGCERILTSGQARKAIDATERIGKLVNYAGNRIKIMPGSGVRSGNIEQLIKTTRATEYHTSAVVFLPDKTAKHSTEMPDFGQAVSCDINQIKEMRRLLDATL